MESNALENVFETLSLEARELYLNSSVPVLDSVPSPLEFYRSWVCPNKPVVIKHVFDHWPAKTKWKENDYLREKIGENDITVAVTPNGFADAVFENKFVMPEERTMTFNSFLDILEGKRNDTGIFYVQKQNSNFTDEFEDLMEDADKEIDWASEAFGKKPDAVNFWIGDQKAVTSLHKDHYENLYCVIRGQKTFTLIPPTDQPYVPYENFQASVYHEDPKGKFKVIEDKETGMVPWIAVDPLKPDLKRYPMFEKARPITVTVNEGETLYLPSLWFHHVQQSHGCIAVNFWYDMEYDIKYNYYKFVENIIQNKKVDS